MSDTQICPWCHMEIVWDEELGPEKECPHCYNELDDYRTLSVELEPAEDVPRGFDADAPDLFDYEEGIEQYYRLQDHDLALDCDQCQERMLVVGEQSVEAAGFAPAKYEGKPPVLKAPFRVLVHVCPSCFQVKSTLDEAGRVSMMNAVKGLGNVK